MSNTNLCKICRHTLHQNEPRPWGVATLHHTAYSGLLTSVASGCILCRWLSLQLPPPSNSQPGTRESFQTICYIHEHTFSQSGEGKVKFQGECSWAPSFDIEVCISSAEIIPSDRQDTADVTSRKKLPPPETPTLEGTTIGSNESLDTVNFWLNSCTKNDSYCSDSINPSFFPTRVIDVQNVKNGTIVLRDKEELLCTDTPEADRRSPKYWTLSHQWGDPTKIVQLNSGESEDTPSNEAQFRKGVSLDELSPTFRDAVQLVDRLGYRYIWIDSLCIFQDSRSDWKHEAAKMKDVYGNSFCNISAIKSSYDASLGLFGSRNPEPQLFYPFSVEMEFRVWDKLQAGKWNFWYNSLLTRDVNNSPLSYRGWVVQGRFLARRVIHFTQTQMYWECLEHSRCETDPDGQLGLLETDTRSREYKATLRKIVKHSTMQDVQSLHPAEIIAFEREWPAPRACWRVMVEAYSRCNLTRESDRLIAIFGVAKRFEQFYTNDRYLAGLWKNSIHKDLTWESSAFKDALVERDLSVAPSWSWASLRGGSITIPTAHQRLGGEPSSHIEFVDCRMNSEGDGDDSNGSNEPWELDIKAKLYYFKWTGNSNKVDIFSDEAMSKSQILGGAARRSFDTNELVARYRDEDDYKGMCIPIHSGHIAYGGFEVAFLIVEWVSGSKYRRLGKLFGHGGWYIGSYKWGKDERTNITLV